jgi:hypothetical protein
MKKKIEKVCTDYICDQNLRHVDVYFEGTDQGKTVAYYCLDSFKVITKDSDLIHHYRVKDAIANIKGNKKYRFPNGFVCWKETHFEVVEAITLEIEKTKPTGTVEERHSAQGMGGLYELADELTAEFETIHKGCEWGVQAEFFDEIDEFLKIKLYETNREYQSSYKK